MQNIILKKENDLVQFCQNHKREAKNMIQSIKNQYGILSCFFSRSVLKFTDKMAREWLKRNNNPYYEEIKECAKIVRNPGVFTLNLSYEWGCTTALFSQNDELDMLRVLDWPFSGLGFYCCVIEQASKAGKFYNITWPSLLGVFQAMAPQRFAAAINQAPMRRYGLTYLGDWIKNKKMVYQERSLPPSHLLRQVFELAQNYQEAKEMLINTPVALPVIYSLSGLKKEEACVIERLEDKAEVIEIKNQDRLATTNHFQSELKSSNKKWQSRGINSFQRLDNINSLIYRNFSSFDFTQLKFPTINNETKLVILTNSQKNKLILQGYEGQAKPVNCFTLLH